MKSAISFSIERKTQSNLTTIAVPTSDVLKTPKADHCHFFLIFQTILWGGILPALKPQGVLPPFQ
jgi:hypothetical protein